jgi:hypothetical protein
MNKKILELLNPINFSKINLGFIGTGVMGKNKIIKKIKLKDHQCVNI